MAKYDSISVAVQAAMPNDVEFSEEKLQSHPGLTETRVGCRPISVLGVPLPDPKLVVYVRATDSQGHFWYVLDWSRAALGGRPSETAAGTEEEAKAMVLEILKTAYPEPPTSAT